MFGNAEVGDRVWDFIYKWGTITNIDKDLCFPIYVKFDDEYNGQSYTLDGRVTYKQKQQRLFWDEIKFEIPERPFDLEKELKKLKVKEFKKGIDNYFLAWDNDDECIFKDTYMYIEYPIMTYFELDSIREFLNNIRDKKITKKRFFEAYKNVFGGKDDRDIN